jgi:hypothetical protein
VSAPPTRADWDASHTPNAAFNNRMVYGYGPGFPSYLLSNGAVYIAVIDHVVMGTKLRPSRLNQPPISLGCRGRGVRPRRGRAPRRGWRCAARQRPPAAQVPRSDPRQYPSHRRPDPDVRYRTSPGRWPPHR